VTNAANANGFLEVCAASEPERTVLGDFQVTVGSRRYTVPAEACTFPIEVPGGDVTISEAPVDGVQVFNIDAYSLDTEGRKVNRLVAREPANRIAIATVAPGSLSGQTLVSFIHKKTQPITPQ